MPVRQIFIAAVVLFAVCTSSAHARLGETQDELCARFGVKPLVSRIQVTSGPASWMPCLLFTKGGYSVECDMLNGHCVREQYGPAPGMPLNCWLDNACTPKQAMTDLLQSNAHGQQWKQTTFPTPMTSGQLLTWVRTDGTTAATEGENLTFQSTEYTAEIQRRIDKYNAAQAYAKAHPGTSTSGF